MLDLFRYRSRGLSRILVVCLLLGCAANQAHDEVIGEAVIPVPGGMERVEGGRVELALPGFGGGRAVFQGRVRPEEVVRFYQTEMPGRGWKENASIVGQGGALAFYKEGRSAVITVGSGQGGATLDILVGKLGN
jgi:hypothetical protein